MLIVEVDAATVTIQLVSVVSIALAIVVATVILGISRPTSWVRVLSVGVVVGVGLLSAVRRGVISIVFFQRAVVEAIESISHSAAVILCMLGMGMAAVIRVIIVCMAMTVDMVVIRYMTATVTPAPTLVRCAVHLLPCVVVLLG